MTGESSLAAGAVGVLENMCEELAIKNSSLWDVSGRGQPSPPSVVRHALCPNQCSRHGSCFQQNCTCRRGNWETASIHAELNLFSRSIFYSCCTAPFFLILLFSTRDVT